MRFTDEQRRNIVLKMMETFDKEVKKIYPSYEPNDATVFDSNFCGRLEKLIEKAEEQKFKQVTESVIKSFDGELITSPFIYMGAETGRFESKIPNIQEVKR